MSPDEYSKPFLLRLAKELMAGLLQHRSADGTHIALPWRRLVPSPYPSEWGGEREMELETLARSFFLAGCILANEPGCRIADVPLRNFYLHWLLRLAGDVRFLPANKRYDQGTVETALICISLQESHLLEYATAPQREQILDWLAAFRTTPVMDNNWHWFRLITNAFLQRQRRVTQEQMRDACEHSLAVIDDMYVGDGWYRDGLDGQFDYYAAWGFQFYPLFLLRWGVLSRDAAARLAQRNDRFLNSYSHLFSRGGHMPHWGRSNIYRFAASAPFSAAYLRSEADSPPGSPPAFDAGFARHISAGNLRQFLQTPWLNEGMPTPGFDGTAVESIDPYTCIASPMWCFKHFTGLLLDDDNPFWRAPESTGWWGSTQRYPRYPRYEIAGTGMVVTHDALNSTLYAPQQRNGDPRYESPFFCTQERS